MARSFGITAAVAGLLMTASTLAVALAAPFAGILSDRFGRRRVIVPAALLMALPTFLAATSAGFGQLLFWRFLQGVFTPGVFAVTVAYINDEWNGGAGAAMAAYVTGTVLGGFSGRMLAAVVAEHAEWQWAFVLLGVLNLLGGIGIWLWLPRDRSFRPGRSSAPGAKAILRHLRNPRLLATYVVGFCVLFCLLGAFTYVNFHLAAPPFQLGTAALGLLFVVYLVGAVITPAAGKWIDRLGHRIMFASAISVSAAGMALTLVPSLLAVVAGLALCCSGVFVAQSATSSYIGTVADEARAAAVGLYVTAYYVGGSFGAAVPGLLWAHGGWTACVALIVAVQVLTVALALAFWRPGPRRDASISRTLAGSCEG